MDGVGPSSRVAERDADGQGGLKPGQAKTTRAPQKKKPGSKFGFNSRILVHQLVDQISAGAALSFDYVSLVTIASILAAVGLATNNVVVIVASMLVSPIMGPILAVCFGTFVFDFGLVC